MTFLIPFYHSTVFEGGKEIRNISVLVGAEKERKALEELLRRRAEFTGRPLDGFLTDATPTLTLTSTSSATATATAMGVGKKGKKVVGFGKESAIIYGFGKPFYGAIYLYHFFVLSFFNLLLHPFSSFASTTSTSTTSAAELLTNDWTFL